MDLSASAAERAVMALAARAVMDRLAAQALERLAAEAIDAEQAVLLGLEAASRADDAAELLDAARWLACARGVDADGALEAAARA